MTATENPGLAVEVRDLTIRRGDHEAVSGATWAARSGEITVILGPNGAGKTTTVEHLEGYLRSDTGSSRVLGLDPIAGHSELSTRIGLMLQSGGIQNAIRPVELLAQYASFYDDPEAPEELLERVGLAKRARSSYRSLSGGEKQRLSLALALVGKPELLFLDEPTAGVDLEGRDLVRSLIRGLSDNGRTVVLTTHDIDEAEQLADHVVILHHGKVVATGSPAELTTDGSDTVRFSAALGLDTAGLAAATQHPVVEISPGKYEVLASPRPELVAGVAGWLAENGQDVGEIRAQRQTLEDVFRSLTSDATPGEGA